ncbi:GNAT family N-acetyltransferase [Bacterioplanes sanyensis]|uniref:GNAT family N-acetyltransferase n=1 Tax=Bacterioplanes sanyensis TaxID=1249553 RepID=UPI0018EE7F54|nr:GNAT family N-acetyltransferase [Bacterioplanes sanyensis]
MRKAKAYELDVIYSIGFDSWNDGLSYEEYLVDCRESEKYKSGTWYVLVSNERLCSSLIVYQHMFGLEDGCYGIGSVATDNDLRGQGYATHLVDGVRSELFSKHNAKAIFLHSDIDHGFYRRLGFETISGSDCMLLSSDDFDFDGSIPDYF